MAIRDKILEAGKAVARRAGSALLEVADEPFYKAESDERPETTPGGKDADTAKTSPAPTERAEGDPKSLFYDPFALMEQLGFRERPSSINYNVLRIIPFKMPLIQAIINLRTDQVASFCQPSRDRYQMGFKFQRRGEPNKSLTPAEQKWADQMSTIIMRTGITENPRGRDSFEQFTRKVIYDSYRYDQACFEVVPNRKNQPAEWYAVDGASIRLADHSLYHQDEDDTKAVRFVQIYDGQVITEYNQEELCFAIRNPRTDMQLYGYGTSELEMLIRVITSMLWAWDYNANMFKQGTSQKGIINFKGAIPEKQLKNFRRHWYQSLASVRNTGRTAITNADEIQWIGMDTNMREMEYGNYFDWLLKQACAVYRMDPVELNFNYGNVGQTNSMAQQNNKEKITESKERGLRPMMRWYADCLNRYIVWPSNESMELVFVGLDTLSKSDVAELNAKRSKTTHTVNELRAEDGLKSLGDEGDVILDPAWMQAHSQAQMMEQQGEEGEDDQGDEESGGFDFEQLLGGDDEQDEGEDTEKSLRKSERHRPYIIDVNL